MRSSIKIELDQIYKVIDKGIDRAKNNLLNEILRDSNKLVPVKTGKLRDSGKVIDDGIEWDVDYAQEVYRSTSPHKVGTREWFEYAKQANLKKWIKQFTDDFNNGG